MCESHDVVDQTRSSDPRSGYTLVEHWPTYPPGMQFEMGSGVAVDAAGIVYLFTRDIEHWAAHPLAMKQKMGKSSISRFNQVLPDRLGMGQQWRPYLEEKVRELESFTGIGLASQGAGDVPVHCAAAE